MSSSPYILKALGFSPGTENLREGSLSALLLTAVNGDDSLVCREAAAQQQGLHPPAPAQAGAEHGGDQPELQGLQV